MTADGRCRTVFDCGFRISEYGMKGWGTIPDAGYLMQAAGCKMDEGRGTTASLGRC